MTQEHATHPSTLRLWPDILPGLPLYAVLGPTLLLGCVVGAFAALNELTSLGVFYRYIAPWSVGVLLCLASVCVLRAALRVPEGHVGKACVGVLALGVLLHAAYALSTGENWRSDFAAMWYSANNIVSYGLPADLNIYDMRALPVLVPLVWVFGANESVVPIANVILLAVMQAVGMRQLYLGGRPRAALAFGVIFALVPETFHASLITSHDIWGLFFLVIVFCAAAGFCRQLAVAEVANGRRAMVSAGWLAVFGVCVALVDVQRQIGIVVVAALALHLFCLGLERLVSRSHGAVASRRGRLLATCVLLLVALASLFVLRSLTEASQRGGVAAENEARMQRVLAGNVPSLSSGYYSWLKEFEATYLARIEEPAAARGDFVEDLILSDIANQPQARLRNHLFRLYRQFNLGSNYRFYLFDMSREKPARYWAQRVWNISFSALFCIALLVAAVLGAGRQERIGNLHLQLCMLGALLLLLDIASESQPRYVFPIWFIGAHLIARCLTDASRGAPQRVLRASAFALTASLMLVVGVVAAGWFVLDRAYAPSDGRILHRWALSAKGVHNTAAQASALVRMQSESGRDLRARTTHNAQLEALGGFGSHALVLGFSSDVDKDEFVAASAPRTCSDSDVDLVFFTAGEAARSKLVTAMLDVNVDGRQLASIPLPAPQHSTHHRIPGALRAGSCGQVEFSLRAARRISTPYALRVARTEIHFARLVPPLEPSTGDAAVR